MCVVLEGQNKSIAIIAEAEDKAIKVTILLKASIKRIKDMCLIFLFSKGTQTILSKTNVIVPTYTCLKDKDRS